MNRTGRTDGVSVFDDWLPPEDLFRLGRWLRSCRYAGVGPDGGRGPEGTLDELAGPLAAGGIKFLRRPFVVAQEGGRLSGGRTAYPSGTPLDEVLDRVRACAAGLGPEFGDPVSAWRRLGAGPKHYPRGHGMDWHDDARFVGTFALYCHDEWETSWGGELELGREGGTRVEPLPNRCVFLRSGTRHRVIPVAEAAGARLRMSVIGYASRKRSGVGADGVAA